MIQLPTVTLLAVATRDVDATGRALVYSCTDIQFAAVKLISPYRPADLPEWVLWEHVSPFPSINEWNHYIVYNLWRHFTTSHCMLVHADGFIVNPSSWRPEFLEYDYIGAPWDIACAHAIRGPRIATHELVRVGNSVGIRSHKLCKLPHDINLEWRAFNADTNEDTFITAHNRQVFLDHGCIFAPLHVAIEFGREAEMPENQHITEPFCFHKWSGRNHIYPHL